MRRTVPLLLFAVVAAAQTHKVPATAGWFPDQPEALQKLLDDSFRVAGVRTGTAPPRKRLLGLIVPHAGLSFSGAIAAAAYARLDHPHNVIVLAFSHRQRLEGIQAPDVETYATPLGSMRVNRDAIRALGFRTSPDAIVSDHSLDNQLPFLRRVAPDAGLIPLFVGDLGEGDLTRAARKLAGRLEQGDVLVASSDLTHYGVPYQYTPFPNGPQLGAHMRERAAEIFEKVGSLDVGQFDAFLAATRDNLCGQAPIRLLMATLAAWNEEVYLSPLDYASSGELTRDESVSVGYGALAFYPVSAFAVGPKAQARLLASSRRTLSGYLASGRKTREPVAPAERDAEIEQRSGLFVTVKKNGELRGCIGSFAPRLPLWDAVASETLAAVADDPRFPAVKAEEGPLSLEISLLTPLKRLASWRDFRLGHGGVIALDGKSGTLLPQVAEEMHWNREAMLENLCLKAGLPRTAYRDPKAALYVYSAQVFASLAETVAPSAAGSR